MSWNLQTCLIYIFRKTIFLKSCKPSMLKQTFLGGKRLKTFPKTLLYFYNAKTQFYPLQSVRSNLEDARFDLEDVPEVLSLLWKASNLTQFETAVKAFLRLLVRKSFFFCLSLLPIPPETCTGLRIRGASLAIGSTTPWAALLPLILPLFICLLTHITYYPFPSMCYYPFDVESIKINYPNSRGVVGVVIPKLSRGSIQFL